MRRAFVLFDHLISGTIFLFFLAATLIPLFLQTRKGAYRAHCQSNQKQLALAVLQYTADNGGDLPGRNWVALAKPYVKDIAVFRCPSKDSPIGASDYFFNGRLFKKQLENIKSPQTVVLMGDGNDDSPLSGLPSAWLTDENSPAWRHVEGANYGFADGHSQWLKPNRVSSDFRMVNR